MKHNVKNSEDLNDIDSSCTNDKSEDGKSDTSHDDQYSDVSFAIDNDEEIDSAEIEEEDWVEHIKRSTIWSYGKDGIWEDKILEDHSKKDEMETGDENHNITERERWLIEAAEWNPELSSKYRTNRSIGRPRKRWEDDIMEFLKKIVDETENLIESSNHTNKIWISTAKRPRKTDSSRRKLHREFSHENEKKFS